MIRVIQGSIGKINVAYPHGQKHLNCVCAQLKCTPGTPLCILLCIHTMLDNVSFNSVMGMNAHSWATHSGAMLGKVLVMLSIQMCGSPNICSWKHMLVSGMSWCWPAKIIVLKCNSCPLTPQSVEPQVDVVLTNLWTAVVHKAYQAGQSDRKESHTIHPIAPV